MTEHRFTDVARAALKERYGELKPEYEALLYQLNEQYTLLDDCNTELRRVGLYNAKTGRKNPLIATIKDCNNTILAILKQLTLTPYTTAKIKENTNDADAELLKRITGC